MNEALTGTQSKEIRREVTVRNRLGIHARPAAAFVKLASRFESEILVEKDDQTVNGKSRGSKIRITARGPDAERAMEALTQLVEVQKFDED